MVPMKATSVLLVGVIMPFTQPGHMDEEEHRTDPILQS
jgi:hypothetical protein